MRFGAFFIVMLLFPLAAYAQPAEAPPPACDTKPYGLESCPSDINAFLLRVESCNHWGGEEPYDDERRKEIEKAIAEEKCEDLACDYQAIMRKYGSREKQRKLIEGQVEIISGSPYMSVDSCVEKPKENHDFNFMN